MDAKDAPKTEKQVLIYHSGDAHGPIDTPYGRLAPGQSLSVPESFAKKMVSNYRHIKDAADIIPGGAKAAELAATERAKLLAQIKALEANVADLSADVETRVSAAVADANKTIEDLTGRLQEFLDAKDKKALDALKEKHADAVPARETAGAAA